MRLVFDTNVVASALLWGGRPRALLQAGREKRVALFTSMPMLVELAEVVSRRKFAVRISASKLTIDQLIEGYALLASVVRPATTPRIAPDPDDDVVIGTALAAQADLGVRIVGVAQAIEVIEADGKG